MGAKLTKSDVCIDLVSRKEASRIPCTAAGWPQEAFGNGREKKEARSLSLSITLSLLTPWMSV